MISCEEKPMLYRWISSLVMPSRMWHSSIWCPLQRCLNCLKSTAMSIEADELLNSYIESPWIIEFGFSVLGAKTGLWFIITYTMVRERATCFSAFFCLCTAQKHHSRPCPAILKAQSNTLWRMPKLIRNSLFSQLICGVNLLQPPALSL